jgi:hypothetical protein
MASRSVGRPAGEASRAWGRGGRARCVPVRGVSNGRGRSLTAKLGRWATDHGAIRAACFTQDAARAL